MATTVMARCGVIVALFFACVPSARAADSFSASIKAGEKLQADGALPGAIEEFRAAEKQAANDTERAIALAKQGYVLADGRQDYAAARKVAEQALELGDVRAVGKVMALQVLGKCQMKSDKDFKAAAETLEKAHALEGVEWAQPGVMMSLGDCYRFTGRFDEANALFTELLETSGVPGDMKAVAHLNMALTYQYGLKQPADARRHYEEAVKLNPKLKGEVDGHLSKL